MRSTLISELYNLDHIYDADIKIETDEIEQRYLINKGQLKESYDKLNPQQNILFKI